MKTLLILLTVLSSLFTTLEQSILQSAFTVTLATENEQPMTYSGQLTMHGEKFLLTILGMEAAYDGETMYMYQAETEELTLSHPAQDELYQTNPFLFAKALAQSAQVSEKAAADGKTVLITLIPDDPAGEVQRLSLRVRTRDNMPLYLEMKERNRVTTLKLTTPEFISSEPAYTISKPDAYTNDLR